MADKKIALDLEINIKKGDMTLGELNSQLNEVKSSLQEQQTALIEYQKELAKLEEQRNAILSKGTISAAEFNLQDTLNEKIKTVNSSINTQKLSIKSLTAEQSTASSAIKTLSAESVNYSKITAGIDKLTGGMATKVVKLYKGFGEGVKAVKGFTTGLSGMKKALLATGIGALVVALGLVVAYWEDIVDFIDGGNTKLKEQVKLNQDKLEKSETELELLELQEDILNEQGLSTKEIVKQKKENIESSKELNRLALDGLKIQRDKLLAQLLEQNFLEKAISTVSGARGFKFSALTGGAADSFKEIQDGIDAAEEKALKFELTLAKIDSDEQKKSDKIKDDKQKASDKADAAAKKAADKKAADKKIADAEELRLAKEKEKALEDIRLGKIDTEAERRQEELDAVDRQYKALIELAKKYGGDVDDLAKAQQAKKEAITKKNADADAAEIKAKADKKLKEQEDLIKTLEFKQEQDANDFELRRAEVARREALLLADDTLTKDQRLLLEQQFAAESKKIDQEQNANRRELASQRLQMAGDILGAINGLAQAFAKDDEAGQRKAFKLNKAAGIGQAIISTAVGINNAFINPVDVASGVAFLKAGLIASSGISQIATISKTQFQGGANTPPPPPTLGSGGAGAAPVGFTQNLNTTQVPTTKVIVTETDIRRATRNIDGIYNKAVVVE